MINGKRQMHGYLYDGYKSKSIMLYNRKVLFLNNIWYDYKSKYLELKNVKYYLQEIR